MGPVTLDTQMLGPVTLSDAPTAALTPSGSDAATSDLTDRSSVSDSGDPLLLASRLQTEEHINNLRHRKKGRKQGKVVGEFYEKQNKQIESLLMTMDQHIENAQEEEDTNRLAVRSHAFKDKLSWSLISQAQIKIAIYGSLIANIVLAILQIYAAASSLSLSFFATAIDAVFDPLANLVLNYCHRIAVTADPRRYPSVRQAQYFSAYVPHPSSQGRQQIGDYWRHCLRWCHGFRLGSSYRTYGLHFTVPLFTSLSGVLDPAACQRLHG